MTQTIGGKLFLILRIKTEKVFFLPNGTFPICKVAFSYPRPRKNQYVRLQHSGILTLIVISTSDILTSAGAVFYMIWTTGSNQNPYDLDTRIRPESKVNLSSMNPLQEL
jgi:hypothetical protein